MVNADAIQHFLLIYDRKNDVRVREDSFGSDVQAATDAYRLAELEYRDQPWMDIVLVGSDSIESIKRTHSTYFRGIDAQSFQEFLETIRLELDLMPSS